MSVFEVVALVSTLVGAGLGTAWAWDALTAERDTQGRRK